MKKIYILSLLILVTALAIADIMSDSGRAGYTGSPGEGNCTNCHTSFPVNSGPGSVTISAPTLTNWEYVLGQTYQVNITVAQATVPKFGFGFEALRTSNNTNAGTLVITNVNATHLLTANIAGSNRTNVVQKNNGGLTSNTHTFSFNWTAPSTNIGNVMFYAVGNATDDQGDSLNDYVYSTSQLLTPFTIGIQETESNQTINVFPNPAHDKIKISIPKNAGTYNFQLFNCDGRLVLNEYRQNVSANNSVCIPLPSNLKNGVYILKAITEDSKNFSAKVFVCN